MKTNVEKIFRGSSSSEELFDAFQYAIKNNAGGIELYKTLLANPALCPDEIKMFAETLSQIFKQESPEIYSWTGKILEGHAKSPCETEESINYFIKSWQNDKTNHNSLVNLINSFNYEMNVPYNNLILSVVNEGITHIKKKSKVYYALSKLYERKGEPELKRKYLLLAEKSAHQENQ